MKLVKLTAILLLLFTTQSYSVTVEIERVSCAKIGSPVSVDISLINPDPMTEIGGYDLLLSYSSELTLLSVLPGSLNEGCGWEYFTYEQPSVNSIKIIGIAETNNGANHPDCFAAPYATLARINFALPSDTAVLDNLLPVEWLWNDCGDNTLSSKDGTILYLSDSVFAFDGAADTYLLPDTLFPTTHGAIMDCDDTAGIGTSRNINFFNGGITNVIDEFLIICPDNIVRGNIPEFCGSTVTFQPTLNYTCADISLTCYPISGSYFPLGNSEVTCYASDSNGIIDSCSFMVTIIDTIPPIITAPQDTTVTAMPGEWYREVQYSYSAYDLCSPVTTTISSPSGTYFSIGSTDVLITATDSSGNADTAQFTVTVLDTEPPQITCPDTVYGYTNPGECGSSINYEVTASDNAIQYQLSVIPESGSYFPAGSSTVLAVAEDMSGNVDSSRFTVIVADTVKPELSCLPLIETFNDPGECGATVLFAPTGTDNCGSPDVTTDIPSGSFFPAGTTLVTATAIDNAGNQAACQFEVLVRDSSSPSIDALPSLSFVTDSMDTTVIIDYSCTISDNCGTVDSALSPPPGTVLGLGVHQGFIAASDQSGNSTEFPFTIEVILRDSDDDGVVDIADNCAYRANPEQTDSDSDGIGDLCCCQGIRGNADGSSEISSNGIDISDLLFMISYTFDNPPSNLPGCPEEVDVDGSGQIDIADILYMVAFMFQSPSGPPPVDCL